MEIKITNNPEIQAKLVRIKANWDLLVKERTALANTIRKSAFNTRHTINGTATRKLGGWNEKELLVWEGLIKNELFKL